MMKSKVPALLLVLSAVACSAFAVLAATNADDGNKSTTVILVRHAEKAAEGGDNPALSEQGRKRANALRHALEKAHVSAIYATQYQRTQQTVQPLADAVKTQVTQIDAADTKKLVAQIREKHRGETVVVAGHSNTVPAVMKAFGASDVPAIADGDYDNLFVLTFAEKAPVKVLHLRYGPPE